MPDETGSRCDISIQKINSGAAPATVRKCGCLTMPLEIFREGEAAKLPSPETGHGHSYQMPRGRGVGRVVSCGSVSKIQPRQTPSIPLSQAPDFLSRWPAGTHA